MWRHIDVNCLENIINAGYFAKTDTRGWQAHYYWCEHQSWSYSWFSYDF